MSGRKIVNAGLKYILAPLLLISIFCSLLLFSYRTYRQHTVAKETEITSPNGISSLEEITLGGVKQWILIRGWDRTNPVLLSLHGGPGNGQIALARFLYGRLERDFVVVTWDQRGGGKSYSSDIPVESMNVEQFVSDTRELAEKLRARFNVPKIYLVGHSWGSMLGALTAARYPDLFHAFVGVGQDVDGVEAEDISYRFVLEKAEKLGNQEALRELRDIGPPPYDDYREMMTQRRWLEEFGGVAHVALRNLWWVGATSPDTSLLDGIRYARGQEFSSRHMAAQVYHVNLFEEAPKIEVPVYFFVGRYDYNTPFELAERYYERLEAPRGKQLIWFENSAHMIPFEEPEKYCDMLIKVLRETRDGEKGSARSQD